MATFIVFLIAIVIGHQFNKHGWWLLGLFCYGFGLCLLAQLG